MISPPLFILNTAPPIDGSFMKLGMGDFIFFVEALYNYDCHSVEQGVKKYWIFVAYNTENLDKLGDRLSKDLLVSLCTL